MHRSRLLIAAAFCGVLSACSYKPGFIKEYKIDIQQGNVLSQEMVAQLKPGQTRDQVRYILGTPLVTDIFHQQRWDYVYRFQNGQTGQVESRRFVVFFDADGRLERVGGDVLVAETGELTVPTTNSRLVDLGSLPPELADKPLPPREEPGFFRRLMNSFGL
ncbi:outer membrane protein assembly factor BamE [Azonexus sp. IMCC34839]|uniref:outer membrane protein assembly factor BamE n=1 Tax=Azonexus sp. IMCC34839 TaxID=3133695 RepID=UPI00399C2E35